MSESIQVEFEQQIFSFIKTQASWELALKKSEATIRDPKELALLSLANPLFLPATSTWTEDEIIFTYTLDADFQGVAEVKQLVKFEKIRALINLAKIESLTKLPVTFFIHPDNLVFDRNLVPKIAYRGLKEKMPPKKYGTDDLLRQYKAFILSFIEDKHSFTDLYNGSLETYKSTKFAEEVLLASSFEEISDYLVATYQAIRTSEEKTKVNVSKNKYRLFQQLSIWMSVLFVLGTIPLAYFVFFREPFQAKILASDTSFFKKDYDGVISDLSPIETAKIPFSQKYSLAYSFVQGKDLSDSQKVVILNNISLKSDSQYLDFWIENGRGNLDEALDIGKRTEDSDLILYALMQKIEQVRNDTSLTGTEREAEIDKLEGEYEKYNKKRDEALENLGGEGETDDLVSSESETKDTSEVDEDASEKKEETKDSEEKK